MPAGTEEVGVVLDVEVEPVGGGVGVRGCASCGLDGEGLTWDWVEFVRVRETGWVRRWVAGRVVRGWSWEVNADWVLVVRRARVVAR